VETVVSEPFVIGVPLGRWQTNCYVVGDRELGTAVVVDPGEHGEQRVPELLERAGVRCEAILLTHGHIDHVWGVPGLARSLDVPVLLHGDDRWIWDDPGAAFGVPSDLLVEQLGLPAWDPPTDHLEEVADGQSPRMAGITFDVRHNPGHTPGHVTYLGRELAAARVDFELGSFDTAAGQVLFSGDLLFAGSVGRSDFPRGSAKDLLVSLAETVLPLEDETLVLCGHGPDTTIGRERATNPFLHEALRHT
jgi:hydroxyacylglutathione hydrolase